MLLLALYNKFYPLFQWQLFPETWHSSHTNDEIYSSYSPSFFRREIPVVFEKWIIKKFDLLKVAHMFYLLTQHLSGRK